MGKNTSGLESCGPPGWMENEGHKVQRRRKISIRGKTKEKGHHHRGSLLKRKVCFITVSRVDAAYTLPIGMRNNV